MYNLMVEKNHPWKKETRCYHLGFFSEKPTKEQLILLFEEKKHHYNERLINGLLEKNVGYLNFGEFEDDRYYIEKIKDHSSF